MHSLRFAAAFTATVAFAVLAEVPARAESTPGAPTDTGPLEVAPRPWLYLDDPAVPAPLRVLALTRATYTRDDSPTFPFAPSPATRPFGANVSRPGGIVEAGAEVGVLPRLSLAASGFGGGDQLGFGALAGLRFEPFQGAWRSTHFVLSGGYLRELNGGDGAWLRASVAQDIRRVRLGATLHGEHVFAGGRDPVDVLFIAGVSCAIAGPVRAGIEYVAQDLEETLADEAEGGVRQFVGPQVALELLDRRLSIVGGPAMGLGPQSPPYTGRLSLAYEY